MNDNAMQVYQTGLKKAGTNAKAVRDMIIYAHNIYTKYGKHSDELDALNFAYRRDNVRSYIKAVRVMPEWFVGKAHPLDHYLALIAVCKTNDATAAPILSEMKAEPSEIELQLIYTRLDELRPERKPREPKANPLLELADKMIECYATHKPECMTPIGKCSCGFDELLNKYSEARDK